MADFFDGEISSEQALELFERADRAWAVKKNCNGIFEESISARRSDCDPSEYPEGRVVRVLIITMPDDFDRLCLFQKGWGVTNG